MLVNLSKLFFLGKTDKSSTYLEVKKGTFMKKQITKTAWLILFGLCIIRSLSAAGINNTGGLFLKPVSDDLQVGVGTLSLYFSISSFVTILFMPIAGKIIHRFPIKLIVIVAALLQAGSFALLSLINSVWLWYLLTIPMAIGAALLVNLLGPILIHRWFLQHSGLALGILMASAGLFGAVLQPLVSSFIVEMGWRKSVVVMGVAILLIIVVTALFTIRDAKPQEIEPGPSTKKTEVKGVLFQDAKKSRPFYGLLIFLFTITAFGALQQHLATLGTIYQFSASHISLGLSLGMIGSSIGAIGIGICCDKWGTWSTSKSIIYLALLSILCLILTPFHYYFFLAGCFLQGLAAMGIPVLAPLLTQELFGERDYEILYSNVMIGTPLATIILLPCYGFLYDMMGNYDLVFLLVASLILLGATSLKSAWKHKVAL